MTRKSKREIERELENLSSDNDSEEHIVFNFSWQGQNRAESPHSELTVQPWPESRPDLFSVTIPKIIPAGYTDRILFVYGCETAERYKENASDNASNTVFACELWDSLSEEDLREEKRIREENAEPIPPVLE